MNDKKVLIVIPTKNSEKHLKSVIKSCLSQSYKNFEILIVDNNSDDDTLKIAEKYNITVINKGPERSHQKNFGANYSKDANYILFLDSDALLEGMVLEECVDISEKNKSDMIIIPERHIGTSLWAKAKALERSFYLGDDSIECPWFFKKNSFLEVGGYSEEMYAGEDWDLFNRMLLKNFKYSRCKSYINHQLGDLKYFEYVNKKKYYGQNLKNYMKSNKKNLIKKIPIFRLSLIKNLFLNLNKPVLLTSILLLKLGEIIYVIIGVCKNDK